jgi:hypothetical protein
MTHSEKSFSRGQIQETRDYYQQVTPQSASMFLQLPGELRNHIYTYLFTSTRLGFGRRSIGGRASQWIKPAPNSLAVLRTCRLIKQEAGILWLGQVLFSFEATEDMLDKLCELPPTTLAQIRRVRIGSSGPVVMQPRHYEDDVFYRIVWVLKLLPGLRLDRLTVLDASSDADSYETLNGFIRYGNGWKELHYISAASQLLGFGKIVMLIGDSYWRRPQPSTWNNILRQRDGMGSGASVTIYRSMKSDTPGAILNPRTRDLFEQKISSSSELDTFGVEPDKQLLSLSEIEKELLVIVKRGRDADIAEEDGPPYLSDQDIRRWTGRMTWAEVKREFMHWYRGRKDKEEAKADNYNDVGEYVWVPVRRRAVT